MKPEEKITTPAEKNELVKKEALKTKSDKYIDALVKESAKVMDSMCLEMKPEVRNALFNLCLACEKSLKDKNLTWDNISKDGLASELLHYAQLNLNPANDELYILPYRKKDKENIYEFNFEESYLGKKKKVKKFSDIKDVVAFLVREGDIYEPDVDLIEGDEVTFKPKPFNNGNVIGAVCYLIYEDKTKNRIVEMRLEELEKVKKASMDKMGGKLSPAWKNWESEMQKKAVLKRALKDVEIEVPNEYQQAYYSTEAIDDENLNIDFEDKVQVKVENVKDANYSESKEEKKVSLEEIDLHKVDEDDSDYAEFE